MTDNSFEYVFDDDEFSDEDFTEIDALIEQLKSLPRASVYMLNQKRAEQMRFAYAALMHVLREAGSDAAIVCKQHEFDSSIGVIRVESVDITVTEMEWFARAVEFATNTEVIPLAENKVRMALMFYGLATPTKLSV